MSATQQTNSKITKYYSHTYSQVSGQIIRNKNQMFFNLINDLINI